MIKNILPTNYQSITKTHNYINALLTSSFKNNYSDLN